MEVGAVAVLRIASPERVPVSPPLAGLVVLHGAEDIFINVFGFFELGGRALCLLRGQLRRDSSHGNQSIRLEKARQLQTRRSSRRCLDNGLSVDKHYVL